MNKKTAICITRSQVERLLAEFKRYEKIDGKKPQKDSVFYLFARQVSDNVAQVVKLNTLSEEYDGAEEFLMW